MQDVSHSPLLPDIGPVTPSPVKVMSGNLAIDYAFPLADSVQLISYDI